MNKTNECDTQFPENKKLIEKENTFIFFLYQELRLTRIYCVRRRPWEPAPDEPSIRKPALRKASSTCVYDCRSGSAGEL